MVKSIVVFMRVIYPVIIIKNPMVTNFASRDFLLMAESSIAQKLIITDITRIVSKIDCQPKIGE